MTNICVITPTIGRPTLERALLSTDQLNERDVWFVVGDGEQYEALKIVYDFQKNMAADFWYQNGGFTMNYGNSQRDQAMRYIEFTMPWVDCLVFLDDDDIFAPNAIATIRQHYNGKPMIFRMQHPEAGVIWKTQEVATGNTAGSMFVVPNVPEKWGKWDNGGGYHSDVVFIQNTLEKWGGVCEWYGEVIVICQPKSPL